MGAAPRIDDASSSGVDVRGSGVFDRDDGIELDAWCVRLEGRLACMTTREVRLEYALGHVADDTLVWREGLGHWTSVAALSEFADLEPVRRSDAPASLTERDRESRLSVVAVRVSRFAGRPVAGRAAVGLLAVVLAFASVSWAGVRVAVRPAQALAARGP